MLPALQGYYQMAYTVKRASGNGIANNPGAQVIVLQGRHRQPVLRQVFFSALDILSIQGHCKIVLEPLDQFAVHPQPVLHDKQIAAIHDPGVCLLLELLPESADEGVACLVFSPNKGVASTWTRVSARESSPSPTITLPAPFPRLKTQSTSLARLGWVFPRRPESHKYPTYYWVCY